MQETLMRKYQREYLRHLQARHLARSTICNYRLAIDRLLAQSPRTLKRLGPRAIEGWAINLNKVSPNSRAAEAVCVRRWLAWLYQKGYISQDLSKEVPRFKRPNRVPRAQGSAEVQALLAVLPDQRARVVVLLMLICGLRISEVCSLKVEDIDLGRGLACVFGKGSKERLVPIPKVVRRAIETYLLERPGHGGLLVRSYIHPDAGLSPAYLCQLVSGWFTDAGVKTRPRDGISAHALRHTAATNLLELTGDVTLVQQLLGHSRLSSTQIYLPACRIDKLKFELDRLAA